MVTLDQDLVRRAASALLKYIKSSAVGKPSLVEGEGEVVLAQIALHKIPGNVSAKPIPIAIPHPLRQREDCDMCLIVKDNAKAWIKDMVEKEPVEGLTKVIKLDKLRTQYKEFKDRRQLLSQFDLFLADDRILPMLTKALGKTFLKAKKQPVPLRLERRGSLAKQIARARDSAFLVGSYGDCWAVKLANTGMTEDQVVENLVAGIAAVVENIPQKWKNVKTINIKCSSSVALPVYSNIGDLPPAPPANKTGASNEDETEGDEKKPNAAGEGEGKESGASAGAGQRKKRKPRPLIRQQLNKLKEEAKAEKAAAATVTRTRAAEEAETDAKEAAGQGDDDGRKKRKKRSAPENNEPSDNSTATAGEDEAEKSGPEAEAAGGKKVKVKVQVQGKAKSPKTKSPKAKATGGSGSAVAVKAAKRRRTAAA
eukprot:g5340.t1